MVWKSNLNEIEQEFIDETGSRTVSQNYSQPTQTAPQRPATAAARASKLPGQNNSARKGQTSNRSPAKAHLTSKTTYAQSPDVSVSK